MSLTGHREELFFDGNFQVLSRTRSPGGVRVVPRGPRRSCPPSQGEEDRGVWVEKLGSCPTQRKGEAEESVGGGEGRETPSGTLEVEPPCFYNPTRLYGVVQKWVLGVQKPEVVLVVDS